MAFRTKKNGVGDIVIYPQGVLDLTVSPNLRAELLALAGDGNKKIVVDLSDVEVIDSSCLGALIDGLKEAHKNGGELRISGLRDQVASMIQLSRLDGSLKVVDPPSPLIE